LDDLKGAVSEQNINATDDLGNTLLRKKLILLKFNGFIDVASGAGHYETVVFLLSKKEAKPSLAIKNHLGRRSAIVQYPNLFQVTPHCTKRLLGGISIL
jgi:hypothetical protein